MHRNLLWLGLAALLFALVHLLPRTMLSPGSLASAQQIEAQAERFVREDGLTGDISVEVVFREMNARVYFESVGGTALAQREVDGDIPLFHWDVSVRGNVEQLYALRFAPDGRLIGFSLPRTFDGTPPAKAKAKAQAENMLRDLGFPLDRFELISERDIGHMSTLSRQLQWRSKHDVEGAKQLLTVEVDSNRVYQILADFQLPDAFYTRWSKRRAIHELLAVPGKIVYSLVLIFGLIIALALRKGALRWREGLVFAAIIAVVCRSFAPTFGAFSGAVFADAISKRLHPQEPSLWALPRPSVWASAPVQRHLAIGIALCAVSLLWQQLYFTVAISLGAYVPAFRSFEPAPALIQQLLAVASNLRPGAIEEFAFRAGIQGGAYLLARRWRLGPAGTILAILLQSVLFASGHADYAQSPPWIRIVELVPFAALFGLVYLRLGLIPVIIAHTLFDVWHELQILRVSAPVCYAFSIALFALPLLPTLIGRGSAGLPEDAHVGFERTTPERAPAFREARTPNFFGPFAAVIGLGALALALYRFEPIPRLDCLRGCESYSEAVAAAREATGAREQWALGEIVRLSPADERVVRLVLRDGFVAYRNRALSVVHPPGWRIYLLTPGDLRGEVKIVERIPRPWGIETSIQYRDEALSSGHRAAGSAEAFPDGDEAFALCSDEIASAIGTPMPDAPKSEHYNWPARRDWVLTWSDPDIGAFINIVCELQGGGNPRASARLSSGGKSHEGAELFTAHWLYARALFSSMCLCWLFSLGSLSPENRMGRPLAVALALPMLGLTLWPAWVATLDPDRSFAVQLGLALPTFVPILAHSVLGAIVTSRLSMRLPEPSSVSPAMWGAGLGLAFGSAPLALESWSGVGRIDLSLSLSPVLSYAAVLLWDAWLFGLFCLSAAPVLRTRGTWGLIAAGLLSVALASFGALRDGPGGAGIGLAPLLLAECPAAIPWFVAVYASLHALPLALDPIVPGARPGSLLGAALALTLAWLTNRWLSSPHSRATRSTK